MSALRIKHLPRMVHLGSSSSTRLSPRLVRLGVAPRYIVSPHRTRGPPAGKVRGPERPAFTPRRV
jgi:hypothetical protein